MHDPNQLAPNGLTFAEIDAREAESVRRANEALAAHPQLGARWWSYAVSHCTFDLIIGDSLGHKDNIAICCPSTVSISGPISWPNQQLRVDWTCDRSSKRIWCYRLIDETAGFCLEADMFLWRQNFDIHSNRSIWFSTNSTQEKRLEYTCPKCQRTSYEYHPFCAECGHKLPTESRMFGYGLAKPVADSSIETLVGNDDLRSKTEPDSHNGEKNHSFRGKGHA